MANTEQVSPVRLAPAHLAMVLSINVLWGLNMVAAKVAVAEVPPFFATGLRFMIVLLICLPWLRLIPGRMRVILALGLLFGTMHFGFLFLALSLAGDIGVVAIVSQAGVPMAVLMAMVVLREHVSAKRWAGIGLTFAGVAVLGFDPRVINYLDAVALVLLSSFVASVAVLLMRRLTGVKPMELQAWIALVSAPCLMLLSALVGEDGFARAADASWLAWGAIAYSAVAASLIGHAAMFFLLQRYQVAQITPFTLLVPVVAVAAGVIIMGDVLTPLIATGAAVTILGVLVITRGAVASAGK